MMVKGVELNWQCWFCALFFVAHSFQDFGWERSTRSIFIRRYLLVRFHSDFHFVCWSWSFIFSFFFWSHASSWRESKLPNKTNDERKIGMVMIVIVSYEIVENHCYLITIYWHECAVCIKKFVQFVPFFIIWCFSVLVFVVAHYCFQTDRATQKKIGIKSLM